MAVRSPSATRSRARLAAGLGALLVLLTTSLVATAQTAWKWRDAQGRVQYSDRPPPPGVADKDILARPSAGAPRSAVTALPATSPASAASAPRPGARASGAVDPVIEARRKEKEASEAAARSDEETRQARVRQDNCQRAREYLRALQDGLRITRALPQGGYGVLGDAERAAEMTRTQQLMASECQP